MYVKGGGGGNGLFFFLVYAYVYEVLLLRIFNFKKLFTKNFIVTRRGLTDPLIIALFPNHYTSSYHRDYTGEK